MLSTTPYTTIPGCGITSCVNYAASLSTHLIHAGSSCESFTFCNVSSWLGNVVSGLRIFCTKSNLFSLISSRMFFVHSASSFALIVFFLDSLKEKPRRKNSTSRLTNMCVLFRYFVMIIQDPSSWVFYYCQPAVQISWLLHSHFVYDSGVY